MPESLKRWLPAILLLIFLSVLIASIRVYVGGPDGLELVWKGGLSYEDTVVNVDDYANVPRKDLLLRKLSLLAQMEEMGLYESSDTPAELVRRRRQKKMRLKKMEEKKVEETKPQAASEGAAESSQESAPVSGTSTAAEDIK